jgi:hypothetical protein
MLVKKVDKKSLLSDWDIIKFQMLTHCFVNNIAVSDSDLEALTLLSKLGTIELTHFCYDASDEYGIFKTSQTVRNCVNKCEKLNLIIKDKENKKLILINPDLKIVSEGSILLNYIFFANGSKETK